MYEISQHAFQRFSLIIINQFFSFTKWVGVKINVISECTLTYITSTKRVLKIQYNFAFKRIASGPPIFKWAYLLFYWQKTKKLTFLWLYFLWETFLLKVKFLALVLLHHSKIKRGKNLNLIQKKELKGGKEKSVVMS